MDIQLLYDGRGVFWTYDGAAGWMALKAAQYPHFAAEFDAMAPAAVQGYSPPFLTALPEAGAVQIWSGLFARTAPNWSVLVRAPANLPLAGGFDAYEGIVEADRWFGPLFINLRLSRTNTPIHISRELPLIQVQPLHRSVYADETLSGVRFVERLPDFTDEDWDDYKDAVVRPNKEMDHPIGSYATAARRRRKREKCPVLAALTTTRDASGIRRAGGR